MVKLAVSAALVCGFVSLVGGLHGYFGPAKSVASLIAGGISGVLLVLGALLVRENKEWPLILVLAVSVGLAFKFAPAWARDMSNIWPALTMTALGVVTALLATIAFLGSLR